MNHQRILTLPVIIIAGLSLLVTACDEIIPDDDEDQVPVLTTLSVTAITSSSARSGGSIETDNGKEVSVRGIVWNTQSNPGLDQFSGKSTDGNGLGLYESIINGLTPSTTYYVRAYATNAAGTAYGNQQSFTTEEEIPANAITDIDGNVYLTVVIGTQEWMTSNLKTTKYRNGTAIDYPGANNVAWQANTTGAYSWHNNEISWKNAYGALYNWYAVNSPNGICPTGWHVPNDTELTQLFNALGGESIAGGKLKSTVNAPSPHPRWETPNYQASNSSQFSGEPGGFRYNTGLYHELGRNGTWWSATELGYYASFFQLNYGAENVYRNLTHKNFGHSVRCIKN
jgi:uncharacterized protein (TIGR02145 family)